MSATELSYLYHDDFLIAVNKPHGLLSVPGLGAANQDCVSSRVQSDFPDALIVHRLDCHTSGVMLLARGKPSQVELNRQFHDRITAKKYFAVVEGDTATDHGCIDQPMRCDIDNRPRQIIDHEHGKRAITKWKLLSSHAGKSMLELTPVTGRSHQLRVHCAFMGTPIVGDRLYGSESALNESRMLLHAASIGFMHPDSGEPMELAAECEFCW